MSDRAKAPYGTSDSHGFAEYNRRGATGKVVRGLNRASKNKNSRNNRKADFENQAKLMEYGANLQDWHQSRLPEHLDATMERMQKHLDPDVARESATYQFGSAKVSLSGSLRKPVKEGKSEKTEENPHGQGQQMKQLAGPRKVFLGVYKEDGDAPNKEYPLAKIPTLTSKNSATDKNGRITSVGNTRYNFGRRSFESNVDERDAYQNQQDVQDQQAEDFHNRGQQMTMFDQHGNAQK